MAGVRGKVPRTSVVGPSLGVNTALNQGARKSTSSSQAPDDMAAPSQPTDQLTDVTTAVDNSSSENVSNKDKQLDFSILPAHIWVNIFSGLNTRDRLNLSVTCWKLRDVCTSCSVLWRSAYIQIGGNHPHYKRVHLNKAGNEITETSSNENGSEIHARLIVSANHIRLPFNDLLNISCDLTDKMADPGVTVCAMTIFKMQKSDMLSQNKSSKLKGTQKKVLAEFSAITDQPNTSSNENTWTGSLTLTLAEVTFDDGGLYECDVRYIRGRSKDAKEAGQICSEKIRGGSKQVLFAHAGEVLEVIGEATNATFPSSADEEQTGENSLNTHGSGRQKSLYERNPLLVTVPVVVGLVAMSLVGFLGYFARKKSSSQQQQTKTPDPLDKFILHGTAPDLADQDGISDASSAAGSSLVSPAASGASHESEAHEPSHNFLAPQSTAASSENPVSAAEAFLNPLASKKSHMSLISENTTSSSENSAPSADASLIPVTYKKSHMSLISLNIASSPENDLNTAVLK